jgi:hypothetical protein
VQHQHPHASVEPWAMDEHRIGLKPILRRVWAPKGATVKAPVAQRYEWMYVFAGCRILKAGERVGCWSPPSALRSSPSPWLHLPRRWEQGQTNTSCWCSIVPAGTAVRDSNSQRGSTWCSCHPIPQRCSPPNDSGRFLAEPLANRVFTSLDELQEVQAERCRWLQAHPQVVQAHTCFHWWPFLVDST